MIPIRSIAIIIMSLTWLGIGIKQWVFDYPDISSLLFAIGFFFIGLYMAYDQWHKKNVTEKSLSDLGKDIMAIDKKANMLEVKVIELKRREK